MVLNGWQRIGVVLSVLWVVGASWFQRTSDVERASYMGQWASGVCQRINTTKELPDLPSCGAEFSRLFSVFMEGSWANVAFMALVPLLAAWICIYLAIGI